MQQDSELMPVTFVCSHAHSLQDSTWNEAKFHVQYSHLSSLSRSCRNRQPTVYMPQDHALCDIVSVPVNNPSLPSCYSSRVMLPQNCKDINIHGPHIAPVS